MLYCTVTVQTLQEDYLILEESLRQLSNITRLERKQLSDELEVASTTAKSDRSFQQQLLQLSDKQKTLLQCFDNQKRLGSQLKILISSQNRYSTRSKTSLQAHSQEYTSSCYHSNTKPISTKVAPKVAIVTTSRFTPFKPVQPVESSVKIPSSSQLTTAVVRQLRKTVFNTSKANSLGVTKQKKLVGVVKQPVGVATKNQQSQSATSEKITSVGVAPQPKHVGDHQTVGMAKQAVDEATPKQAVEVTTYQSHLTDAVTKSQCPMPVISHQQKPVGVAMQQQPTSATAQPMGVATQHSAVSLTIQKEPVGVATKQLAVGVAKQSLDVAAQPVGVATQHSTVGVTTHKQSVGVATKQSAVGVAMQKQPASMGTENQSMETDIHRQSQSVGGATQHAQLVDKGKHTVSMQQPRGVATKQPMRLLLQSELAQPVPLDVLLQHQLISPREQCLTCTLMVAHVPLMC